MKIRTIVFFIFEVNSCTSLTIQKNPLGVVKATLRRKSYDEFSGTLGSLSKNKISNSYKGRNNIRHRP